MSQSTIYNNNNCFNNTNHVTMWSHYTMTDDRTQLLTWLSRLEPRLRHQDIQERRVEKVGEWLMQTPEFGRWRDRSGEAGDNKEVLFCYGDPGVGKTFISSLVVDKLCDQVKGGNVPVTCFYFEFAARKEQSATSMLGSLLKQIMNGMERIPEEISVAFQEQKKAIGGRAPQLSDIVRMLQTITSSQRTFICIDALDECAAVHRAKLLNSLNQILEKSPDTRIFVTGRPHIQAEIKKRLAGRVSSVSIDPRKDDIIRYLRVRLDEDESPDAMDESLEAEILQKIPENISEMFLLASLNIKAILQESTIYQRRERLNKMADGLRLGDAYSATIERIKAQGGGKSKLGLGALMWISHAERPLRADELCHALGVEIDSINFNASNVPSISTLVGCCQGLITVDKEASTVRLIHFTLHEYLSAHPDIFTLPQSTMAEICLTYMNSKQIKAERVKALSAGYSLRAQDVRFLEYCSVYWGVHAKRELSDCAISLALKLFQEDYGHICTKFLLGQVKNLYRGSFGFFSQFSGLHCASYFGIVEVVTALIETEGYDINRGDFSGHTPLAWAARNGHEEVVTLLFGWSGVNPDKADCCGQTPLSHAALNGYEGVVKILLGWREVNPDKPGHDGRTPLSYATSNGCGAVVKILLERKEVNPDKPGNGGRTPLSYAASRGHEGVVKMLLGREEVNPGMSAAYDQTPLSLAAENVHDGVVEMLLGREEVNPDKPDHRGRTPLSYAAWNGHEGVVKMLLGREEVNPEKIDYRGQTPLSLAALNGYEGVVKILLGREEVNPDKPGDDGRTPLSYAASNGREAVVKTLLGWEEVSPDKADNEGKTPLSYASLNGFEGVVKILLALEEVNPDKPNNYGKTPLSYAASNGREGVVKILLEREEVNPDEPNIYGRTPLSFAAQNGHDGVVKMLLGREDVNPEQLDHYRQTPLDYATRNRHLGVVELL